MTSVRALPQKMRAARFDSYGPPDTVEMTEVVKPVPGPDEVLVRVRAASINPYDWHFLTGLPYVSRSLYGLRQPKVHGLGADLAGVVEAVGATVTKFAPGDEVFGEVNGETPGLPYLDLGSLAEYVAVKETFLEPKPVLLSFEEAAAVPLAAITAYQGLHHYAHVGERHKVLINGASGGVGTFAVQIAKALGAEVTGVCGTRNIAMVSELGADRVLDYTRDDFIADGTKYHLMMDNVGNRTLRECRSMLEPRGMYLASFGQPEHKWLGPVAMLARIKLLDLVVSQKLRMLQQHRNTTDLAAVKRFIDSGLVRPVIDRSYPLEAAVEALEYLLEGHASGKVVITV